MRRTWRGEVGGHRVGDEAGIIKEEEELAGVGAWRGDVAAGVAAAVATRRRRRGLGWHTPPLSHSGRPRLKASMELTRRRNSSDIWAFMGRNVDP